MQIPLWFQNLASDPQTARNQLVAKIPRGGLSEEFFNELLTLFGRANLTAIKELKGKVEQELNLREINFFKLLKKAQEDLSLGIPLLSQNFTGICSIPVYSGNRATEVAISKIKEYLLSLPMPYFEAMRYKCFSFLEKPLESYQTKLNGALEKIFKGQSLSTITLEEEAILFKSTVIPRKKYSLGLLFFAWVSGSTQGKLIEPQIQKFCFNKILLPAMGEVKTRVEIAFSEYLAIRIINDEIFHVATFLPILDFKADLQSKLSKCFKAQQSTAFFINYLETQVAENQFSYENALELLRHLIKNNPTDLDSFLHTALHYYHCLTKFKIPIGCRKRLFEAIHSIEEEEKKHYDEWIVEHCKRKPFDLELFLTHSEKRGFALADTGRIVLKFTMSKPKPKALSLYLSLADHIRLFQKIESQLHCHVPKEIEAEFLYFQTIKGEFEEPVDCLIKLRANIETSYIKCFGLPQNTFEILKQAGLQLVTSVNANLEEHICLLNGRLDRYLITVGDFVHLAGLSTYPLFPYFSFSPLASNKLLSLHPEIRGGPWLWNGWTLQDNHYCFHVSLLDSLEKPKVSTFFSIQLPIDGNKVWVANFFEVLLFFFDRLGAPTVSDEDKLKMEELYNLPDKCLFENKNADVLFDKFITYNSYLKKYWEEKKELFGTDCIEVKSYLFEFIKQVRIQFKKGFYLLKNKTYNDENHFDEKINFSYIVLNKSFDETLEVDGESYSAIKEENQVTLTHFESKKFLTWAYPLLADPEMETALLLWQIKVLRGLASSEGRLIH